MGLQVVAAADARVGHYRRARAHFEGRAGVAVAAAAALRAGKRMVAPKLVPHLVRHVVNIKGVAHRVGHPGFARGLQRGVANHPHVGQPAPGRAEYMADVVIARAHHGIHICLVFAQQVAGAVIGVGVGAGVGVDEAAIVAHQLQVHGQLPLIHPGHAVHRRQNRGLGAGHRATAVGRVLGRGGHCQPVSAQGGAGGQQHAVRRAGGGVPAGSLCIQPRLPQAHRRRRSSATAQHIALEEAQVVRRVAAPRRVEVHRPELARQHHTMKALGRDVEPRGGVRVVEAAAGVGAQLREAGRRGRVQHR